MDRTGWWAVMLGLHRSRILRRIAFEVLVVGVYAAAITWVSRAELIPSLPFVPNLFPLGGILLSLLLAFRTNTAYDRWWEGRKLWEGVVNELRGAAVLLDSGLEPGDELRRRDMAELLAAYPAALRWHLRGRQGEAPAELEQALQGTGVAELPNPPLEVTTRFSRRLHQCFREGALTVPELRNLANRLHRMVDLIGACERIRATPIPYAYNAYLKALVAGYCLLLPFGMQAEYGYLAVVLEMAAFAAMVGLETLATDIEDPFGADQDDLPLVLLGEQAVGDVRRLLLEATRSGAAAG